MHVLTQPLVHLPMTFISDEDNDSDSDNDDDMVRPEKNLADIVAQILEDEREEKV